ncbi:uncharacterized protein N7479_008184 [Penicillium vulpinum]|uniref:uncharacterized protein n=1 Tax=Penicillium vulpinum TaxID=29845 RepID=UPI0025499724|nr:uncharacterized protein N7479_008184 [Penicillium vulpinum]KAJ5961034.1 hypothetical protein N7479_008184 [Penicillium vulpinum]
MKVDEKNTCRGKENLNSKANEELKNKRHGHMLLIISVIYKRENIAHERISVLKGPTVANYQETTYDKEVFDNSQTSLFHWKRYKIMILALVHRYIVPEGRGSIFSIENSTYTQISTNIKIIRNK